MCISIQEKPVRLMLCWFLSSLKSFYKAAVLKLELKVSQLWVQDPTSAVLRISTDKKKFAW